MVNKVDPTQKSETSLLDINVEGGINTFNPSKASYQKEILSPLTKLIEKSAEIATAIKNNPNGLFFVLDLLFLIAFFGVIIFLSTKELDPISTQIIIYGGIGLFLLIVFSHIVSFISKVFNASRKVPKKNKNETQREDNKPSLEIVLLTHEMMKSGKDYQKIIYIYNNKFNSDSFLNNSLNISLIRKVGWLANWLVTIREDDKRTDQKIRGFSTKKYDESFSKDVFSVLRSGKIVVKEDWGGDYALLYALYYAHEYGLNKHTSNSTFSVGHAKDDWWSETWKDVALYASQICNDDALIRGMINIAGSYKNKDGYKQALALVYRIIQLKPSISKDTRVHDLLSEIIYYKDIGLS